MNAQFRVIPDGVVYIALGSIIAVKEAAAPPPEGFASVKSVSLGGTIYPGLIDLHNHLAYNALPMWMVPKQFTNRDQWGRGPEYRRLVSGPMTVVGKTPELLPAVVRYVECKNLMAGVTTSQGIELFSNAGVRRHYRGLVRNVEQTDEEGLPEAGTRVADVDAATREKFLARLKKKRCFLLHLSEGTDAAARAHFDALRFPQGGPHGEWAIAPSLCGIHCAALRPAQFDVMGSRGASMIWSPMSNLLLYGQTADVSAARNGGVRIGLGADWSPSGSKNLLAELKVARAANEMLGGVFNERQLVAMATRDAAAILGWQELLGSLDQGKRADLICLRGRSADPYAQLLEAKETDLRLVVINGVPRYGLNSLMKKLGAAGAESEFVRVGGLQRTLQLRQASADPVVGEISLAEAIEIMTRSFARLPELARALETGVSIASVGVVEPARVHRASAARRAGLVTWSLALDEIEETGAALRPRVPARRGGPPTGPTITDLVAAAAAPLSQILTPMTIDPLTTVDDEGWVERLRTQRNLPPGVRSRLLEMFA
jgi:cytosine/adenosine deaminase-related metal-dependent hydrolase